MGCTGNIQRVWIHSRLVREGVKHKGIIHDSQGHRKGVIMVEEVSVIQIERRGGGVRGGGKDWREGGRKGDRRGS